MSAPLTLATPSTDLQGDLCDLFRGTGERIKNILVKLLETNAQALNESHFTCPGYLGFTALHLAAEHGNLNLVPKEFLTPNNLSKQLSTKFQKGKTVLHIAAQYGHLDQLPAHCFTAENLSLKCDKGETAVHVAARGGHLDQIPAAVLTNKILNETGSDGGTVFHVAAFEGHLDQIPEQFLILSNFGKRDSSGMTVVACARYHDFKGIPKDILEEFPDETEVPTAPGYAGYR
jgi:ankyrin repeat protein